MARLAEAATVAEHVERSCVAGVFGSARLAVGFRVVELDPRFVRRPGMIDAAELEVGAAEVVRRDLRRPRQVERGRHQWATTACAVAAA